MNSNNFSYSMPTKIIYGIDQVQSVGSCINHRRAILITSQGFFDRGLVDKVSAYADSIVGAISNVQSHPEFVDVEKLYQEAREYQFDLIIAMDVIEHIKDTELFINELKRVLKNNGAILI